MTKIDTIISDADGTLVDTVDLIRHGQHETATTFLRKHGVPEGDIPSFDQYQALLSRLVGGSARQTLELTVRALYEDKTHHLDGADYDELHRMLNPVQDRLAPEYVRAFPGLSDTLNKIGKLGVKFAIFSSGTPHHIVRNFGIALGDEVGEYSELYNDKSIDDETKLQMFEDRLKEVFGISELTVVTADDVGERTKPDPLGVEIALKKLNSSPDRAVVLGDHGYDLRAGLGARAMNLVGITHGFDSEEELLKAGATSVVGSLKEFQELLAKNR